MIKILSFSKPHFWESLWTVSRDEIHEKIIIFPNMKNSIKSVKNRLVSGSSGNFWNSWELSGQRKNIHQQWKKNSQIRNFFSHILVINSKAHLIFQTLKTHFSVHLTTSESPIFFLIGFSSCCFISERNRKKLYFRRAKQYAGHKQFFSSLHVLWSSRFNTWENLINNVEETERRFRNMVEGEWWYRKMKDKQEIDQQIASSRHRAEGEKKIRFVRQR